MSPFDASVNGARRLPDGSLQDGRSGRRKEMEGVGHGRSGRRKEREKEHGRSGRGKEEATFSHPAIAAGKKHVPIDLSGDDAKYTLAGSKLIVMMLNFILQDVDKY